MPRTGLTFTILVQGIKIFIPHRSFLNESISLLNESNFLLRKYKRIIDLKMSIPELYCMLYILNFPFSCQTQHELPILLFQSFSNLVVHTFPLLKGLFLAEITHNQPINIMLKNMLDTPGEKGNVLRTVYCCQS